MTASLCHIQFPQVFSVATAMEHYTLEHGGAAHSCEKGEVSQVGLPSFSGAKLCGSVAATLLRVALQLDGK